ncbi:unnamed protein product [[Candida] boidinii]|uniref:Unnamed protein product n=1 Tax=Candida boidinii TaxID=5477 RepID=A0ACB5U5R2_CANBO|nr:unnamed protein product [[Candida] boidinii]GMF02771.1 unnamed protein product [[Candida] boidinii]
MSDHTHENAIGNSVTPSSIEIGKSELNQFVDQSEENNNDIEESESEESTQESNEESDNEESESESESEDEQENKNESGDEDDEIGVADEIISEIRRGVYTCLVCTGEIDEESPVWSCHHCFRVYDLNCIKNWAKNGSSTASDNSWRCPSFSLLIVVVKHVISNLMTVFMVVHLDVIQVHILRNVLHWVLN